MVMNSVTKKIMVYSLIGAMQVGFGATVIEASPLHNNGQQRFVQLDDRNDHDNGRRRQHDERKQQENERHEREMQRRRGESERDWHERQRHERERHENALREIAALLIGIAIGSTIE